jgi:glycosyltransferase involved in cell wall biosynthesis
MVMASKKKRLLLVDLGGSMGGVESYLISLSSMLREHAEIHSVCALPELAAALRGNGVRVHVLPRFAGSVKTLRFLASLFLIPFLLLRHRIDLLQVNGFLESVFLLPARALGREAVYTRHGPFEDDLYSWYRNPFQYLPRLLARTCVRFATRVICVSEAVGNVVREIIPDKRLSVIPNWVAVVPEYHDRPCEANQTVRLLYVGRLEKYKGLQLVVEAMRGLSRVHLTVLGDGSYRRELEAQAAGVDAEFLGFQKSTTQYYAAADVFVMPSMGPEGLPMVTIEAMAHSLPCLFSDLAVHQEITGNGHAGMLFRNGDVEDLRAKLITLLNDSALRRALSREAYEMVKRQYNPETARLSYLCALGL